MMKRLVLLTWLLATFINTDLFSQSKEEIRNNFFDAESWILFESYKDALPIYQQLLKINPANANYKYRIGQCYMNIPGEKAKAVSYLEDAVKNINPNYKEGKYSETRAPYDALYYLANAYRINNQLDKALTTYEQFRKNLNPAVYDTTVVNLQIQSCHNAIELMKSPLYIKAKNLGRVINGTNNDFNPVVSEKEDLIVFSRSQPFYDALMYSVKVNGVWSEPQNMNELLKVDRDLYPTCLSKDGKELYLYSSADYDGNIYRSKFENGTWSPILKLNDNINTKFWESHAVISHDNKKLYFTSNRKGTFGGLDIYVSNRDSTGDWGPAINLGPEINTPYNEESPFLSSDDKTLFFSSRGHYNMGGYDIFYSKLLDNGSWSVPVNIGSPLNTSDDDLFFNPIGQGFEGYISKELAGGYGKQDIYKIEIFSDKHPRQFFVKGTVKAADLIGGINDSVRVSALNLKDPNHVMIVYSNPKTGEYEFQLPQGNYQITYEGDGSGKVIRNLDLALTNPSDNFLLPGTLLPKTDFAADLIVETNKTISVTKGDSILFPMKVEPRSVLTVEHWVGDSLKSVENFTILDSVFNYKMAPDKGKNRLVFKLTDRFNNTTRTEVLITRQGNRIEQQVTNPEYSRIISEKQIASLSSVLKNRADKDLAEIINETKTENQQFGKIDDYITFVKENAARKGVKSEDIDKLALKVAVMDNILTQAAVDYLARHTDGDLNRILTDLNIYEADLKSWTDLQEYVSAKTGGKIKPEDLNKIAAAVLSETDPAILLLQKKVLAVGEQSSSGDLIRQTVVALNQSKFITIEDWLKAFYYEALKRGLTLNQLSEILVQLSSSPGTKADQYLTDLIDNSDEPLKSALKSIDLKKEKINTPQELLLYLFNNKDKYPEENLIKAIANLIVSKDIPEVSLKSKIAPARNNSNWIIWVLAVVVLIGLTILFRKKRKDIKK
jgi:tetratricopeptide (TPR) repeat protein